MAHVPSLMIFDDHDVTDDWNLTADWERCAYGHPFSKRIIGNALVAYLLCQGWGNAPDKLNPLLHQVGTLFDGSGTLNPQAQDRVIERLQNSLEGYDRIARHAVSAEAAAVITAEAGSPDESS